MKGIIKHIFSFIFLFFCIDGNAQRQKVSAPDTAFLSIAFAKTNVYMDKEQYDSAQEWLNKIHDLLPYLAPSVFNYALLSRQAEVYYYNNLPQLGLQQARRGLQIAEALNDSALKADSYNFLGLFYMGLDSNRTAINYFNAGIKISPVNYKSLDNLPFTHSYHLLGNLSESYEKLGIYDSALLFVKQSLKKSLKANEQRAIALAYVSTGRLYSKLNNYDSAVLNFEKGNVYARESGDIDVELLGKAGMASCQFLNKQKGKASNILYDGLSLLYKYPNVNSYFSLQFLQDAARIFLSLNDAKAYASALELTAKIQKNNILKYNRQTEAILNAGVKNETQLLQLEVNNVTQKQQLTSTRLSIVILTILIGLIGFFVYRYYTKQKLRVAVLRNKISQDLHDEVGATLSGIALYGHLLKNQITNKQADKVDESIQIIQNSAGEMVTKLNDIVWSVNPGNDSLEALIQKIKDFTLQLAVLKNIDVDITVDKTIAAKKLGMDQRKNIYLICKEAINNALKYSEAKNISLNAFTKNAFTYFIINDNGKGFNITSVKRGNGLNNMQQRAAELKGQLTIDSNEKGSTIKLTCKIP